jgi:sialic acid synthase SpsE
MRDQVHIINTNPVDKNIISKDLRRMRDLFGKSIALKFDLKKGSIIKKSDLTMKKPGFGFKENQIKYIVGRKLIKNVTSNRILKKKDLL